MDKYQPVPFKKILARALKDPEFKREYDALEPEFAIIRSIIRKRLQNGMSQKQLAQKMGTQQSALSRLESGTYNPSLAFLKKVSSALEGKLKISIVRRRPHLQLRSYTSSNKHGIQPRLSRTVCTHYRSAVNSESSK